MSAKRKFGPMHPIRFAIEHLFWGDALRWREVSWFGHAWYHLWDWTFRKWDQWIVPHLTPRRWERENYAFLTTMRIPPRLNGFVYGNPEEGYCAEIIEAGGPWKDLCLLRRHGGGGREGGHGLPGPLRRGGGNMGPRRLLVRHVARARTDTRRPDVHPMTTLPTPAYICGWPTACAAETCAGATWRPGNAYGPAAFITLIAVGLIAAPFLPRTTRTMIVPATPDPMAQLATMERQAATLSASMAGDITRYVRDVEPIERALLRRARDPWLARQAAWALVFEAEERDLSPRLVSKVLRVENPWLIPDTTSFAGAVGWMQIMPLHVYDGHPCGTDLTDGITSVCYGSSILRDYLGRALDRAIRESLNSYSGCVRTPGCESYAMKVINLTEN